MFHIFTVNPQHSRYTTHWTFSKTPTENKLRLLYRIYLKVLVNGSICKQAEKHLNAHAYEENNLKKAT